MLRGLPLRVKVDKALAEPAAVIAGGNLHEAGRLDRCGNRRLRGSRNRGEIPPVEDDLHHGSDIRGDSRLVSELLPQGRAETLVSAGDRKGVATAGFRSAA